MTDDVLIKYQDSGLMTLRLNRPDCLNSFNLELLSELSKAFDDIATDNSIRAVMVTGTGRGFCTGADLSEAQTSFKDQPGMDMSDGLLEYYDPLILKMTRLPKPIIAAVNGVAAGAGCSFALGCDIVIAGDKASFLQAFGRIGVVPDMGATWHLPRLVGQAKAMGLAMLADEISALDAERMGLIWNVVPHEDLMNEATKIGHRLAKSPTQALASMKLMIRASLENTLERQLEMESRYQSLASRSHDFKEGVTAFLEKRKPHYKGC